LPFHRKLREEINVLKEKRFKTAGPNKKAEKKAISKEIARLLKDQKERHERELRDFDEQSACFQQTGSNGDGQNEEQDN